MANIKSAKKRILVNQTRYERTKKVEAAVANKDKETAQAELIKAIKLIETAGSKGVFHKNNVARKVSRLTKAVNSIA